MALSQQLSLVSGFELNGRHKAGARGETFGDKKRDRGKLRLF